MIVVICFIFLSILSVWNLPIHTHTSTLFSVKIRSIGTTILKKRTISKRWRAGKQVSKMIDNVCAWWMVHIKNCVCAMPIAKVILCPPRERKKRSIMALNLLLSFCEIVFQVNVALFAVTFPKLNKKYATSKYWLIYSTFFPPVLWTICHLF